MSKLKPQKQTNVIRKKFIGSAGCVSDQHPWFSFRYMTRNSAYNLKSLPEGKAREQTLLKLYERLEELSGKEWLYWNSQPKKTGTETIEYSDLNFTAGNGAAITGDSKLYVFRFDTHQGTGGGRIIGYKESPCAVLHIIGFDLDYSAYNHGK